MNRGGGKARTFQKPKNRKYVLKRLWDYLFKYKWLILLALILTVLSNSFALVGPKLLGNAIDAMDIEQHGEVLFDEVIKYAILMIVFYVLSSVLSYLLSRLMIRIGKKVVFKMRQDAFDKLQSLPVSYFDGNTIGDIISKMSYDIDTINTSLSSDFIAICTSVITVVGALIMMFSIAPILVLVFAITLPISLFFTRFMLKRTHKLFKARSQTLGDLNGYVEEMVTGNKTIRAYGREKHVIDDFERFNNIATDAAYKAEYYGAITGPGVNFVNNLSISLICVFGSLLYILNYLPNLQEAYPVLATLTISLGSVSSFIQYSRKFSGPINEVANIFVDIQSALAAGERVFNLIDATEEKADCPNAIALTDVVGAVKFENVKFGYIPEKTIIHDLSFNALAGKQIAIVGPTGAGKTTIVNLLMRFYDIDSGNIYLDNNNIYEIKRKDLRKSYAMVLQDTWLFQASVYENLSYSREDITLEDVIEVCKVARIHHFIERLPQGYDTILSEGGVNISKGQRQLLTIARAMLLDAKMLILDEATSNVDTRTEIKIQEAMKKLMENKTCFIIAHRLSTIKNADLILVVKDGNIVEQGTHNDLLKQNGFYSELYYSQFK